MKKALVAPLCSAFIIPGLGQVINQNLLKGGVILAGVFFLFIAFVIRLVMLLMRVFGTSEPFPPDSQHLLARLRGEDLTLLYVLVGAFALLWLYSVLDAFWLGLKLDRKAEKSGP